MDVAPQGFHDSHHAIPRSRHARDLHLHQVPGAEGDREGRKASAVAVNAFGLVANAQFFVPVFPDRLQIPGIEILYDDLSVHQKDVQAQNRLHFTVHLGPFFNVPPEIYPIGIPQRRILIVPLVLLQVVRQLLIGSEYTLNTAGVVVQGTVLPPRLLEEEHLLRTPAVQLLKGPVVQLEQVCKDRFVLLAIRLPE